MVANDQVERVTSVAVGSDRAVRPWWVLTTCCLAIFLIGLNTTAINAAVTQIADDLSLGATTPAFAINAYLLGVAIFVMPAGTAADVLGIANVFLIGLALFAVGSLLIALAEGAPALIGGRITQGAGSAFLMPASMSALRLAFTPERRATALGIWGAIVGVAFAVGPLFGGAWTDAVSWRGIYWSDFVVIAVAVAMTLASLRPLPRPGGGRLDLIGGTLMGGAILLLVLAAQYGQTWGWTSVWTLGALVGGLALLGAFVEEDSRSAPERRLLELGLLRNRAYTGGILLTGLATIGLICLLYFWNLFAQSPVTLAQSAVGASLFLLPYGIAIFVMSLVAARLADRIGYRIPVAAGMAVSGAGFLWLADIGVTTSASEMVVPLVILGVGVGFTFSNPGAAGLSAVTPDKAGEAAGAINASRYVLAAFGLAVASALYLTVASGSFRVGIAAAGLPAAEEDDLEAALTGTDSGLTQAIDSVGAGSRAGVEAAAQAALTDGFRAATALNATIAFGSAIISLLMLPGRRRA